jgi:hypothetical protein
VGVVVAGKTQFVLQLTVHVPVRQNLATSRLFGPKRVLLGRVLSFDSLSVDELVARDLLTFSSFDDFCRKCYF